MIEKPTPASSSVPTSSAGGRIAATTLAVLIHIALVSAAVETFRSGSLVRWWVAGAVVAYLLGLLATWRAAPAVWKRLTLSALATAGGSVFFALIAATAWLPGGKVAGIRLFGLATATLLSAVSAAAVALAGIPLIRLRLIPAWARYALGALAAYGASSFVIGIASATPYTSLLRGGSFWTRLPFWLQGAFVGGLVVLPLGLTVMVVQRGPSYFRRAGAGDGTLQQAIALALSLVMTVSGVAAPDGSLVRTAGKQTIVDWQAGPPAIVSGAEVSINTRLELPPPPPPEPTTAELDASINTPAPGISDERYNPEAQARALGPGVEPTFRFVTDRIRYESYSGILRGADGTLAARAGNAFDRSLLLAKMLAVHGVRTRFVRGDLPKAEADTLFGRIFEGFLPTIDFADTKGEPATPATRFWARVTARARRDYTVIRAALGTALPAGAQSPREQALRDIQQHVWVQAEVDGRWLDLDSSFAAASPGHAYCAPRQTVEEMPPDWHQRVTMRVTEERLEDGTLTLTPALEATWPAIDLLDQEVFLVHVPDASDRGATGLGAAGASQGGDRWAPALSIGEDLDVGRPVSFKDAEASPGFYDALSAGSSSALVAEWLEFEVLRPDGRRDVTRRALVERATPTWRAAKEHTPAALRPLARNEQGLVDPRAVRNIWFSASPHNLRSYADVVAGLALAGPEEPDREASLDLQLLPLAASNFATLVWADDVIIPTLNDLPQVRLYSDSPRIIIVSVTPDTKSGVVEEYDLRRDWLCGLARDASADALAVDRKIWFAALEGALEHEVVAQDLAMAGGDASAVVSTSSLLTAAGVVVLGPSDVDRLPQLTRDPEKIARLGAALRSGSLLAVPRAALASGPGGWWELAPGGDARAVLDGDLNGSRAHRRGGSGTTSSGATKPTSTTQKSFTIRDPPKKPHWSNNFGKKRPRPPKEQKSRGLEYGMITAVVVLTVFLGVKKYGQYSRKTTDQLDLVNRASGSRR
jgi:hypothetical protein